MTILFNTNPGKLGSIDVSEDNTHFLVRIHPEDRDRAKKIVGRQWDGDRKAWVYPKDSSTYEALIEEFQKDADSFNIRRPKTKRPVSIKPLTKEPVNDEFENQHLEEIYSSNDVGENQGNIHSELEQIREMLGSLGNIAANHSRTLDEVREYQEHATREISKFELLTQQVVETELLTQVAGYSQTTAPTAAYANGTKAVARLSKTGSTATRLFKR